MLRFLITHESFDLNEFTIPLVEGTKCPGVDKPQWYIYEKLITFLHNESNCLFYFILLVDNDNRWHNGKTFLQEVFIIDVQDF